MKDRKEDLTFHFVTEVLLRELLEESSYIAKASCPADAVAGWSDAVILSEDEHLFAKRALLDAYAKVCKSLSAYLSDALPLCPADGGFDFILSLPCKRMKGVDAILEHHIDRALVTHVLSIWFLNRLPEQAVLQAQIHESTLSELKGDLLRCGERPRRIYRWF